MRKRNANGIKIQAGRAEKIKSDLNLRLETKTNWLLKHLFKFLSTSFGCRKNIEII